ncbi:MAG: hypothetical protein GY863_02355, partial [bacterium]|nr:hypothetical protein [bacterium]
PVRVEQDIVASPLIGLKFKGFFIEAEYYLSIFSQNFEPSIYGNAGSASLGYSSDKFLLSYQCFYNSNYYHQDAHLFYLKRKNVLNRIRFEYEIFRYEDILDLFFTTNLYGMDPPGIDFRLFVKIDLSLFEYRNKDEASQSPPAKESETTNL